MRTSPQAGPVRPFCLEPGRAARDTIVRRMPPEPPPPPEAAPPEPPEAGAASTSAPIGTATDAREGAETAGTGEAERARRAQETSRALARELATPEGARRARLQQLAGELRLPPPALELPGADPGAGAPAATRPADGQTPAVASAANPGSSGSVTEPAPVAGQAAGRSAARPRPISIWQPHGTGPDLAFVRPAPGPLGDHFAARREIRPKRTPLPLRVVLFGESAAAGYLYAPDLTPAGVLEAQLRAVTGEEAVEVIDLARTNETLGGLAATLESAVQIQPDVLVIFAGNNWNLLETPEVSPYAPAVAARQRYAAAWRAADGPAGPVALAAERLTGMATVTGERIALIARAIGVPVVLVVPEVSLAGWESRQPLAWPATPATPASMDGRTAVARWYRLLARARGHLERGAWPAAARTSRAMIGIDGGRNPTSWRLLARAREGAGDARGAATAARAEIDAAAYPALAFLGAPQATSRAQELLRQVARRHGFALVDLPAIFAAHTGSPLPGRHLFLDYCHLTAEGIEVAMAAVAAEVLHLSGIAGGSAGPAEAPAAGELAWPELLRCLPPLRVPPRVEAVARFGAALHGAHRLLAAGRKAPLLETWCEAALAASPGIASAMLDLVAARAAPLPAVLTPALRRNLASGHRFGLPHGWRWEHVDAEIIGAIFTSLERHANSGAAPAARSEIERAIAALEAELIAGRGIRESGTDLLAPPFYLWEPLERFLPEVMTFDDLPRPGTFRAAWPETSFCLICGNDRDAGLEIAARLPLLPSPTPGSPFLPASPSPRSSARSARSAGAAPAPGAGARRRGLLRISVNDQPAAAAPLRESWTRTAVRLPRHLLRHGRNRLTLHWPPAPPHGDAAVAAAIARLEEGIVADLHPVFGELFSVTAHLC